MYNVYYGSAYINAYADFFGFYYFNDPFAIYVNYGSSCSGPTKFCALKVKYK